MSGNTSNNSDEEFNFELPYAEIPAEELTPEQRSEIIQAYTAFEQAEEREAREREEHRRRQRTQESREERGQELQVPYQDIPLENLTEEQYQEVVQAYERHIQNRLQQIQVAQENRRRVETENERLQEENRELQAELATLIRRTKEE